MFILQTVYDTVTEQKCETKARDQQTLIKTIFPPEKSQPTTMHISNTFFLLFFEKLTFKNNLWSGNLTMKTPLQLNFC